MRAATLAVVLLYVWVASWELECCRADAVVGERWGGSLILDRAEPWWSEFAAGALPDDVMALGVTEFVGDVASPPRTADRPAVATVGSARIGVLGTVSSELQHFRGRLQYEGHGGGPHDDVLDELDCDGVVRNVRGIAYDTDVRHTSEGEARVPVSQRAPVDLNSSGDHYPTGRSGHAFPMYLVDLDVD